MNVRVYHILCSLKDVMVAAGPWIEPHGSPADSTEFERLGGEKRRDEYYAKPWTL